ncbi:hypothetical protein BUALT_Bualt19G0046300 [Buddleja alternifolia]|uniref:Reverse transcriptase n=1 Tax=Buddleja alternifolia TaxID=168488 RepID=A0AAV6W5I3_9LAMI|nr:hypothetical protein BUALT_Bualt19G0046300 [Buddleja alternifolia]
MWTRDSSCKSTILEAWSSFVRGSPSFSLHSKIKTTRFALRRWNRSKFGHCQRNISLLQNLISSIQSREPTIENRHMEDALVGDLNELLMREEIMWRQRAKQKWLKDGDANTRFFHLSTIIHRRYNTIHSLKNSSGSFVHSWFDIGTLFHSYFKDLFTSSNPSYPLDLENIIPCIVSDEDNRGLLSIPTPCEIKKTVFSMAANKTPGPDGMSPLFYKTYWDIVGIDVVKAVTHFFETGHLLKAMNHTFITLIPKSDKANKVEQFRPISLCNGRNFKCF